MVGSLWVGEEQEEVREGREGAGEAAGNKATRERTCPESDYAYNPSNFEWRCCVLVFI